MFKKLNLFSKTERKLLAFVSKKDGELYERQIADGAGVSVGSANRMLKGFARLGALKQVIRGRMLFYRRNDDNPLLRQFKVFNTINELMPLIEKLAPFCSRIVLFGSCAEGRNGEKSDVDLFILSNEKEKVRRILDGHDSIQAIVLNSVEYSGLQKKDKPLYKRMNAGVEIYGGEDG